jgi:hypothetical protein
MVFNRFERFTVSTSPRLCRGYLTFVPLLLIDLITGFGYLLPRYVPSARGLALITGVLLSAIALVQGLRPPVVQNYAIELSSLRSELDGTTIVAIADMHLGPLIGTKWLEARTWEWGQPLTRDS